MRCNAIVLNFLAVGRRVRFAAIRDTDFVA